MSVRLALASRWLPPWVIRRELTRVGDATTAVLDCLLREHAPRELEVLQGDKSPLRGSLRRRRRALAAAHTARIAFLVNALGRDAASAEARRRLFEAGGALGDDARRRLGVRRTRRDLVRAARVLYRVLGIRFRAEWTTDCRARVEITRCALAHGYSRDTCLALSATDAGVVAGLWPGAELEFDERITEGRPACIARLTLPRAGSEEEP